MVEMGKCIGGCRNMQKCFFVKDYFMCGHLCCYNLAVKFKLCIKCGNDKWRYVMIDVESGEIVMNNTIIKTTYCYCVRV